MSYEWNWSQDVEKCPLDLVLSSFTHTNAVQAIALASKECPKFLPEPLPLGFGSVAEWLKPSTPINVGGQNDRDVAVAV